MQLIADGFKVALLGETRQEGLHAVVELVFIVELEEGEKMGKRLGRLHGKELVSIKEQCMVQFNCSCQIIQINHKRVYGVV